MTEPGEPVGGIDDAATKSEQSDDAAADHPVPIATAQKEKADEKSAPQSESALEERETCIATRQHRLTCKADRNDDQAETQKKARHEIKELEASKDGIAHACGVDTCFASGARGDIARTEAIADGGRDRSINRIRGCAFAQ